MKRKLALLLTLALGATSILPAYASASDKKTITMWTIATEGDANHEAFQKAIEEYVFLAVYSLYGFCTGHGNHDLQ